jgi:gamma-glutamylcyclotransferase (GGCT)/AIG2-like uncharacterized protein YtfP
MSEEYLPFFCYGTLRPRDFNYLLHFEGRTQQELSGFSLPGMLLYDLGPYPMMQEASNQANVVIGDLIYVPQELYTEVLADIDVLEDYYSPNDPENHYNRFAGEVIAPDGVTTIRAWYYVGDERYLEKVAKNAVLIPYGDWLRWKQEKNK